MRSAEQDIEFYLDRTRDALNGILKSIVLNPTLEPAHKLALLSVVANEHDLCATVIKNCIDHGVMRGIAAVAAGGDPRELEKTHSA